MLIFSSQGVAIEWSQCPVLAVKLVTQPTWAMPGRPAGGAPFKFSDLSASDGKVLASRGEFVKCTRGHLVDPASSHM